MHDIQLTRKEYDLKVTYRTIDEHRFAYVQAARQITGGRIAR